MSGSKFMTRSSQIPSISPRHLRMLLSAGCCRIFSDATNDRAKGLQRDKGMVSVYKDIVEAAVQVARNHATSYSIN
jgi:hypothetical protein